MNGDYPQQQDSVTEIARLAGTLALSGRSSSEGER